MNSRNRDGNPEFENHLLSIKTVIGKEFENHLLSIKTNVYGTTLI